MHALVGAVTAIGFSFLIPISTCLAAPDTPAKQYAALLKEYGAVSLGLRKAETDLGRKTATENMGRYPEKFLALAKKYPKDPIALVSLKQAIQAVNSTDSAAQIAWESNRSNFPAGSTDETVEEIVTMLLRHHLRSSELVPTLYRIRYGYRMGYEKFLRAVLQENPGHDVQAVARLSLAQFLNDKLRAVQLAQDRAAFVTCCENIFGKDLLSQLEQRVETGLALEVEAQFEKALAYTSVKYQGGGTIAEKAQTELYEIRNLSVGKMAPDIEGKDQDGVVFKLSDYRGKVVLLYPDSHSV